MGGERFSGGESVVDEQTVPDAGSAGQPGAGDEESERGPRVDGGGRLDAGCYLARARRVADVSQRELADRAGISAGTLARYESGTRDVSLAMFERLLGVCGLRLVVVDGEGTPVTPFPADAVRDNAGRRFPAHLDLRPPDDLPDEAVMSPRYDRVPVRAWYHRRAERDRRAASGSGRTDHATGAELELRRLRQLYGRSPWWPEREAAIERRLGLDPGAAPGAD